MYRRIIAVDPGVRTGIALWGRYAERSRADSPSPREWYLERALEINLGSVHGLYEARERLSRASLGPGGTLAVIEAQYLGPHGNFQSVRRLVELCGFMKGLCALDGMAVIEVAPARWGKTLRPAGSGRLRRGDMKRLSREVARQNYAAAGAEGWTDNVCDAVHLGRYVAAMLEQGVELSYFDTGKEKRWTRKRN